MLYALDLIGVAVFAVSGALAAGRQRMDFFGVIVVAVITAIGGGTIRDVILDNRPLFWTSDANYLYVILLAALVTMFYSRFVRPPRRSLLVADAFGLGLFTYVGAEAAYNAGTIGIVVVMMGVVTGVAGGILRDVLCNVVPLVLRREVYATAAILGGCVYLLLQRLGAGDPLLITLTAALTTLLRLAAIRYDLDIPPIVPKDDERT
ncbi:trimeric intracellular cation channel family protein [Rubrobacter indicoceani]|uniref:trimeric intracellular cation channel family protein n=1 Tax=Rubrobacter indicoceani TaxID=2051957 RepID=UPI000E5A5F39|nr:trimeric intracellular cation channel family protein [Rubrobacter indicoceani]